jgi:hypothetical protein
MVSVTYHSFGNDVRSPVNVTQRRMPEKRKYERNLKLHVRLLIYQLSDNRKILALRTTYEPTYISRTQGYRP